MKELSIEEKAKRYDEAIEKFDVILNLNTVKESGTIFADDVRKIFPELKDSDDEKIKKEITEYFKHYSGGDNISIKFPKWIAWLEKQGEQNHAWNEHDERMCNTSIRGCKYIIENFENSTLAYVDAIAWLKSLKGRVQSQNLTVTDEELAQAKKDAYNDALDKIEYHSGTPSFDDGWSAAIWYLKKRDILKSKSIWKPSDEQMQVLIWCLPLFADPKLIETLKSLIDDLKKL